MPSTVDIGDMRERVELQSVARTRDSVGGLVETWTTYATVWASVQPMSQRESFYRQQTNASAAWKVSIRYRPDVVTKHRVKWRSHTFEVRGVNNSDVRRRFIEMACDEIVAP